MQFSLEFLHVWGSLERMKRNFNLCDFEACPNKCFQLFAFFFFLNQFFWEAHLIEKSNAVRGEPFQDLPEELKVTVLSGEVWERRVWWYQLPLVLSEPFQFLINPSWVCQACSCKSKQLWWKSSGPLKLNLWAEVLFIGNFLMQKWGKNTHWNAHWSLNPVP